MTCSSSSAPGQVRQWIRLKVENKIALGNTTNDPATFSLIGYVGLLDRCSRHGDVLTREQKRGLPKSDREQQSLLCPAATRTPATRLHTNTDLGVSTATPTNRFHSSGLSHRLASAYSVPCVGIIQNSRLGVYFNSKRSFEKLPDKSQGKSLRDRSAFLFAI